MARPYKNQHAKNEPREYVEFPKLDVLYEDEWMAAVSKPEAMLVHRTEIANGDTVFAMQCAREQFGKSVYVVHRLDRATSGVLLFAFSSEMASVIGKALMSGHWRKRYMAVVRGWIENEVTVDHALKPPPDPYVRVTKTEPQSALSVVTPVAKGSVPVPAAPYDETRLGLESVEIFTGRRHQIRRHLKFLAHPVIGDSTYGKGPLNRDIAAYFGVSRMYLHCARMALPHPVTGKMIDITAPAEAKFAHVLEAMGWQDAYNDAVSRPWPQIDEKLAACAQISEADLDLGGEREGLREESPEGMQEGTNNND